MFQGYAKARQFEPGCDLCGTPAATIRVDRFDPLALPGIDPKVVEQDDTPREARMALNWLDTGYLDEATDDWSAKRLVQAGFNNWAQQWLGDTPNLSGIHLCYAVEKSGDGSGHENGWDFTIELSGPQCRMLFPRYMEIEAKAPGLFETAINALERSVGKIANTGTPAAIRGMAIMNLWCGIDDESDYRAEMACCGWEEEEIDSRCSPGMYDGALPKWLLHAKKKLSNAKLAKLGKVAADTEVGVIAKQILQLNELRDKIVPFDLGEQASIYPLALLRWDQDDEVLRCFDDVVHEANSGSDYFTAAIAEMQPGLNDDDFLFWMERIEPALAALKIANQLIGLLSVPDEDNL